MKTLRSYILSALALLAIALSASAQDLIATWQLPPVAGVNTVSVGFNVIRPSVQANPLKILGTFQIGATAFNTTARAPGSYLVSENRLQYMDPNTFQKVPLTPQPGDIWRISVSVGIEQFGINPPCSPAAWSAGCWIPVDGQSAPTVPGAYTDAPQGARQTVPPPVTVTLTFLPK